MAYNKITLHGGQVCDYLLVKKEEDESTGNIQTTGIYQYVDSEPSIDNWDDNTLLLARFDNSLVAGNSSLLTSIAGYEIRRQNGANPYTEFVGKIENESKFLVDFLVGSKCSYTYFLYPNSKTSENDRGITLSPNISNEIKTDWNCWSLLVVDESDEDNIFYLNKMFKFELNLTTDDMNNNAVVNVIQNFTKYPTVQYGTSNYWTGGLTALCGFISCNDTEYIQTPNMIKELKSLTSDNRRKFLKDMDGNIYEVKITSPITISTMDDTLERAKTVKISWTEIGEVEGLSVINNPNKPMTNWVLTETGEVVPYVDYIWDKHYRWDNSYRWTAKEDLLSVDASNLGRDLYSEDGDENA